MAELNKYMNKAFDYEEKGFVEEAIMLCSKCMQAFPEYSNEIELEIAKMNYRNGRKEQALIQFLSLHQETGDIQIRDLILEAYYGVRQQEFEKCYKKNYKQLKSYPYFLGDREEKEICYYPIWAGEKIIWYYDSVEDKFQTIRRIDLLIREPIDEVGIASDLLWLEDILIAEKMTRKLNPSLDSENALLLVYQKVTWILLLQMIDLKDLIAFDRIIFYDDKSQLEISFLEKGICLPTVRIGIVSDEILAILYMANLVSNQNYKKYKSQAERYYEKNGNAVIKHIKEGNPKILFLTSRFTTSLQYQIRDCKAATEELGLQTELSIEKDRLDSGSALWILMKKIADFKPDIIFILDHFRHEYQYMSGLDNVVWICWIQDALHHIFSKDTPIKQTERDIVISNFCGWDEFQELGYRKDRLVPTTLVANPQIYCPCVLSEDEETLYTSDICMVCHSSDVDASIEKFSDQYGKYKSYIKDLYQSYVNYVKETNHLFLRLEEFQLFIYEFFRNFYKEEIDSKFNDVVAKEMRTYLNVRLYRQLLADWVIDAGYTNIKLWGNGWKDNEKYAPYAMGAAENGEVLSKILQASKIVLGNNIVLTGASRVSETLLSGAFYMANYIPPEVDINNIRPWLKEGEELVFFNGREDLLDKIKFYLENEDERKKLAKIGREKALEKLTFHSFMQNVITETGNMF